MSSSPTDRRPGEAGPARGSETDAPGADAPLVDLTMPQMGVSVVEGTVTEWKKQPGDQVERDEVICSISTDKIETDVESPAAGRVAELLVEAGATVEVGAVLARVATGAGGGDAPEPENGSASGAGTSEAAVALEAPGAAGELQGDTVETAKAGAAGGARMARRPGRHYSPVVMRIAAEHGLDLQTVEGTGRGGRVRKQDVLAFMAGHGAPAVAEAESESPMHIESPYKPEPMPPQTPHAAAVASGELGPATRAPLSRMRQAIGGRMLESLRTAATCTTVVECDMSAVQAARERTGLTYLPYVARAATETLREFPALNATLEGDTYTRYESVHLGIAVSLGQDGLIVPVIHHAQELSEEGLGRRISELARRARGSALTPDEVRGATFTITNPGAFGAVLATPVINQPQVAILDFEAVVKRAVVLTNERTGADSIAIRPMTYFCMSWDHRAIDGALAAQFLSALRRRLEAAV